MQYTNRSGHSNQLVPAIPFILGRGRARGMGLSVLSLVRVLMPAILAVSGLAFMNIASAAGLDELSKAPSGPAVWNAVNPVDVKEGSSPGDILWVQHREDAPKGALGWTVVYVSEVMPGQLQYVSGEIYVSKNEAVTPRPIVLWNHPTAGMEDTCAPSRRNLKRAHGGYRVPGIAALLDAGYVVVMSDYPGLGMSGQSFYMAGPPNARASLDMARAALEVDDLHTSNKLAMYGWSQGGQTSLWADELAAKYAPELDIVGTVLMAPASDILDLTLRSMEHTFLAGYVIATLPGIKSANPKLNYSEFLTVEGLSQLPSLAAGCFTAWSSAADVTDPYQPDALAPGSAWWKAMADAQDYDWSAMVGSPILTIQGTADTTVPPSMSKENFKKMCKAGVRASYVSVEGANHGGVVPVAAEKVPAWFAARFAGEKANSDCP